MSNIVELTDHSVRLRCPGCGKEFTLSGPHYEGPLALCAGRVANGIYCLPPNSCGTLIEWPREARRILHERKFGRQLPLPLEVAT